MKLLFLSLLITSSNSFFCFAQDESIINYTTKDGLPSSQVYDIIQDDYGYLWFSTDKGLSRYDGYEFENFNKSHGLTGNVVFDLIKRPDGKIWATTNSSSLFYFEGADPKFKPYKYNKLLEKHAANKVVHSLYISQEMDVYLSFHDHSDFLKISNSGKLVFEPERFSKKSAQLKPMPLIVVSDDRNDPFYFTSDSSQSKKELKENKIQFHSSKKFKAAGVKRFEAICFENEHATVFIYNNDIHIKHGGRERYIAGNNRVIASGKLSNSEFWVGYLHGGVTIYNLSGEIVNKFLDDYSVTQIFVDHEDHTWISTLERGVFLIRNKSMNFLSEIGRKYITAISKGPNDDLYIGGYNGQIYHRASNGDTSLFFNINKYHQPVNIAYDESKKQIYFSSGTIFDLKKEIYDTVHVDYISIIDDRYLANGTFGLRLYDIYSEEQTELFGAIRTKDVAAYEGSIYAASIYGLYKTRIDADPDMAEIVLSDIRIDDLTLFSKYLALGTNGEGLILMDKFEKPTYHIKQNSGLTSNYISKSYAENDSTLWVCTNKGINKIVFDFSKRRYKIEKIDVSGGLVSNEVWDLSIFRDTIWVGTQNGVNYISKKDFSNFNEKRNSYFLQWKSMRVNDVLFQSTSSFNHNQNKMEFRFLGISFAEEKELIYQYKLLGLDENWSYTKNLAITYSSLSPGSYELIVRIKGKSDMGNEIRYAFTIHPPYWKTWWFISLCFLGFAALVYLFFKIRVLTYNKDVVRGFMRYILQKLRREDPAIVLRQNGKDIKVKTGEIHYIKTSGNYLEINLSGKSHLIRSSISKFMESLPDKIEFVQVHRSYIVRIDKVQQKGKGELIVLNTTIPVGRVYMEHLKTIDF